MCASFLLCIYHLGLLSYVCASVLLCIYHLGPLSYVCASLLLCIYHSSIRAYFLMHVSSLFLFAHPSSNDQGILLLRVLFFVVAHPSSI